MKAVYLEQQHLAQMACFCVLLSVSRSERLFFYQKKFWYIKEFERKNDIGQSKGYLKICNDIPVHVLKISYVMQYLFCNLVILQNWQLWNSDCQLFTINLPVYSFQLSKNIQIFKFHEGCHLQFYMDNNSLGLIYSMCIN